MPLLRTGMEGRGRSARKIASKRNCGNLVEAGAAPLFFGALGNELARHKMNTVITLSSISSPRDSVFRSNFATAELRGYRIIGARFAPYLPIQMSGHNTLLCMQSKKGFRPNVLLLSTAAPSESHRPPHHRRGIPYSRSSSLFWKPWVAGGFLS